MIKITKRNLILDEKYYVMYRDDEDICRVVGPFELCAFDGPHLFGVSGIATKECDIVTIAQLTQTLIVSPEQAISRIRDNVSNLSLLTTSAWKLSFSGNSLVQNGEDVTQQEVEIVLSDLLTIVRGTELLDKTKWEGKLFDPDTVGG